VGEETIFGHQQDFQHSQYLKENREISPFLEVGEQTLFRGQDFQHFWYFPLVGKYLKGK